MSEHSFWEQLRRQHGLGTVWQAEDHDVPRHRVRRLIARGALRRVAYGIVAASGAPESFEYWAQLGLLFAGPRRIEPGIRAALCGPTAAQIMDLIEPRHDDEIHVLSTRRLDPRDGFVFHWSSRLPENELTTLDGFPCTDEIRTFIDMCDLEPHRSLSFYRRGLRKKLFIPESVRERIDREARQGRGGICAARRALEATFDDAGRARSALEDRYFDLLVGAGYPTPERNVKIRGSFGHDWEVDLYYRRYKAAIEISPVGTHSDPLAVQRDQRKIADLTTLGIRVLPVGSDLSDSDFLRLVRRLLGPPDLRVESAS